MSPDVRRRPSGAARRPPFRRGPHWIALFAAVFTLPLLYVGGSVTTYRVGLAVPDWPTTFGINMFLYDFWNAPFGVRIEHAHRLYGAAVGLATMLLAGWFLVFERAAVDEGAGRARGGGRDRSGRAGRDPGDRRSRRSWRPFTAVTGQAFFGLMVALCVLTGRDWQGQSERVADVDRLSRPLALLLLGLVVAQIVLGSWLRHYGTRAALVRPRGVRGLAVWAACPGPLRRVERRRASAGRARPLVAGRGRGVRRCRSFWVSWRCFTCYRLTAFPGRSRFIRPWSGPVIRPTARSCWRRRSCSSLRTFRHLAGAASARLARSRIEERGQARPAALDWEAVA